MGTLRVTKACLPLLKKGAGRVVMVSSVAGMQAYPGLSVYCATKHAMEGLSQVQEFSAMVTRQQAPGTVVLYCIKKDGGKKGSGATDH